jgi:hypothetical protein
MNFERIYLSLRETIKKLEGKPRKSIPEARFLKWFHGLDKTSKSRIINAMDNIHKKGQYGAGSHEEQRKPGLFGIAIGKTVLRVYFTEIDEKYIRLEGGSSSKDGSGQGSSQDREIETIWNIVQTRRN